MVRFLIVLWIKKTMLFKKRFAKKDYIDHILIGNFFVDLQLYPHSELWRLCIRNIKVGKQFILSKRGAEQFKAEYKIFVSKVIDGGKLKFWNWHNFY